VTSDDSPEVETPHESELPAARLQRMFGAERAKAFIDAVVAIAMTLLILPLMESVTSVSEQGGGAAHWFDVHQWQLITFVISFAVIASFWLNHHHLFARVHSVSTALLWVSCAWLLTIVWMPIATAMTGSMSTNDPLVKIVYIGSMFAASLLMLAQCLVLQANPWLHDVPGPELRRAIAGEITTALLFVVSLAVSLIPAVGLLALFLMMLTGPVYRIFARLLGARLRGSKRARARH
jgi:uncharacterized membrane protein